MTIDRIGKNGTPHSAFPEIRPKEGSRPFFEATAKWPPNAGVEGKTAVHETSPSLLQQLRDGRIDVNGYVDRKVEWATAHLHGLGAKRKGALKEFLREQAFTDPALVELVTQASRTPAADDCD